MFEKPYLSPQLIDFIRENMHRDLAELALEAKKHPEMPMPFVIDQIYGKRKAKFKLPNWFANEKIIYPPKISIEQCSSEQTAAFKSSIISGNHLIDLTGGFGVDATCFANTFQRVTYVEQHPTLVHLVRQNAAAFGLENMTCHQEDGIAFLQQSAEQYDWIYLDPARRDEQNKKMVGLESCHPNVLQVKNLLLAKADHTLLKLSPMLDIRQAITQLDCVQKVWVVAVQNECKELLFQLGKTSVEDVAISCVNIQKDDSKHIFEGFSNQEYIEKVQLSAPKAFVYEPNAAIMKGGLYKSLAKHFALSKLHPHSHLYTSDNLVENFPGRSFQCIHVLPFNKKAILKLIPAKKVNITVRNFPLTVAEIRKKTGLKDGGEWYLFATTNQEGKKICLLCKKV
ncbi:MAG: class I SAM-dependent methyltransferase [Flammeovirgaceae bacterium]